MSTSDIFNPTRLALARRRRGMTKTSLAAAVDVNLRSISAYEAKGFSPKKEQVAAISRALNFPETFFFGDDVEEFFPKSVSFRSLSTMTARQRDVALGSGAIALLLNDWIEQRFDLPSSDVPDLGREMEAAEAALTLRQEWLIGELPIKNMVHLCESRGVRVYSLADATQEIDAFSTWKGGRPFIFLNTLKSAERARFDAAHELGHLVLHHHAEATGKQAEKEANDFASALLMPKDSVNAQAPPFATLDHLMTLKKIWGVSLMAMTFRLHKLGHISDWHYQRLCQVISRRGARKEEPEGGQRESSQIHHKVFSALRAEGIGKEQIAHSLRVCPDDINDLVFGLALTSLKGAAHPAASHKPRANLKLVSSRG